MPLAAHKTQQFARSVPALTCCRPEFAFNNAVISIIKHLTNVSLAQFQIAKNALALIPAPNAQITS